MLWLNKVVDEIVARRPDGDILIESGGSPSGTYHLGHLRELITSDAILAELKSRGRQAKHIYYVDDLDALRKVPVNVPSSYEKYLGMPLYKIPSPDDSDKSYADFFLQDLIDASRALGIEVEFVRTHQQYQQGFFTPAIEQALEQADKVRTVLENVSGHKLGEDWSPIQINEEGYLKKRRFISLDKNAKTVKYVDKNGQEKTIGYQSGDVKLDWRIDWPARWWLLKVDVEPFGRDHATKGGSYDTGAELMHQVFNYQPPLPVPYDFVNLAGDTKKMSASKGTGLDAMGAVKVLPPEIIRFFMLRYPPSKRLYFDPENGVSKLIDEFAELLSKNPDDKLVEICRRGVEPSISPVPFTHLVASYQSAIKNPDATLDVIKRTEHGHYNFEQIWQTLKNELKYIDQWLASWAPEEVKFELKDNVDAQNFSDEQKKYLNKLAEIIASAPDDADGEWFHKAVYQVKEDMQLTPQQVFQPLYKALIDKDQGPRAGWFLATLASLRGKDWLVERLRLTK